MHQIFIWSILLMILAWNNRFLEEKRHIFSQQENISYLEIQSSFLEFTLQNIFFNTSRLELKDYLLELATSPLSTAKRNFFSWYVSAPIVRCGRAFASSSVMPWMLRLCKIIAWYYRNLVVSDQSKMHNLSMDANHVCQTHLGHLEFMGLLRLNVLVVIVEPKILLTFLHKDMIIPFQV